jgi:hypothetical protein
MSRRLDHDKCFDARCFDDRYLHTCTHPFLLVIPANAGIQ